MRRLYIPIILSGIMLIAVFGLIRIARGQGITTPGGMQVVKSETQEQSVREIYAPAGSAPDVPNISFIDSPSPTCYQPDSTQDTCYINWYYMSVDANPNYMIAMTATISSIGPVMRVGGFFQTSMYVPYNMLDKGIKVACGPLGAGGNPYLGKAYAWTISARDSSNLKSANYGTTYCPAFTQ